MKSGKGVIGLERKYLTMTERRLSMDGWNRVKIVFPEGYECWLTELDVRKHRHTTHKCINCGWFRLPHAHVLADVYHGRVC